MTLAPSIEKKVVRKVFGVCDHFMVTLWETLSGHYGVPTQRYKTVELTDVTVCSDKHVTIFFVFFFVERIQKNLKLNVTFSL